MKNPSRPITRLILNAPSRTEEGVLVLAADLVLPTSDRVRLIGEVSPRSQARAGEAISSSIRTLTGLARERVEILGDWSELGRIGSLARAVAVATACNPELSALEGPCCGDCAEKVDLRYDLEKAASLPAHISGALARASARALMNAR